MKDIWTFSKSTVLTLVATSLVGIFVLTFAYHLRHYAEILSGVIGGLTIILGMVTGEWLRSTPTEAEKNLERLEFIENNIESVLFNAQIFSEGSLFHKDEHLLAHKIARQLYFFEYHYRWPQPNAREIRKIASELGAEYWAMMDDASENELLWSAEKRYKFLVEFFPFFYLLRGEKAERLELGYQNYLKYRETERRPEMKISWRKQAER